MWNIFQEQEGVAEPQEQPPSSTLEVVICVSYSLLDLLKFLYLEVLYNSTDIQITRRFWDLQKNNELDMI